MTEEDYYFRRYHGPAKSEGEAEAYEIRNRVNPLDCPNCKGTLWVCENHPDKAWDSSDGCECGAGMPCACNPDAILSPGAVVLFDQNGVTEEGAFGWGANAHKP